MSDRKLVVSFLYIYIFSILTFGFMLTIFIKFKVLGIPWDVNTEGLREYMSKFGELEDCVVMKVS